MFSFECLAAIASVLVTGFGLGYKVGKATEPKVATTLEMPCSVLIKHVYEQSKKFQKPLKPQKVKVEAINGKNTRCSCFYLDNQRCKLNGEVCIFFK